MASIDRTTTSGGEPATPIRPDDRASPSPSRPTTFGPSGQREQTTPASTLWRFPTVSTSSQESPAGTTKP